LPTFVGTRTAVAVALSFTMASKKIDVLILGGGVVGMSTACHLAMRGVCNKMKVAVVEKDSTYSQASAMLSAGGMRQQFSLEDNVKMSLYGVDFIRRMRSWPSAADVQFKEQGYVFLAKSDEGVEILRQNHLIQTGAGANIQLLPTRDLQAKFPWMDTSEIQLGSFGSSGEGWFDPWTLLNNMKRRAVEGGVAVIDGSLQSLELDDSSCSINHANIQDKGGHIHQMTAGTYIMTTGAWAAHSCMDDLVSRMGGLGSFDHWPVRPKKRCIFSFHCPSALEQGIDRGGLTVDPSGVYFRPEGKGSSNFICGVSPPSDRDKDVNQLDTQDVDHQLFEGVTHLSSIHICIHICIRIHICILLYVLEYIYVFYYIYRCVLAIYIYVYICILIHICTTLFIAIIACILIHICTTLLLLILFHY
jgi:FAD-dependent oxidoreductase domain-containing protein 1